MAFIQTSCAAGSGFTECRRCSGLCRGCPLAGIDLDSARRRLDDLAEYAWHALQALPSIQLYSPAGSHILAFNLGDIHPHDVAQVASEHGVAVRAGHHCCQPLLQYLEVPATVRLSLALYNDERDIDALVTALKQAAALFGEI